MRESTEVPADDGGGESPPQGFDGDSDPRDAADVDTEERSARDGKFRQAAFVYLHVGLLYEAGVFVLWRNGFLGDERGPVPLYLLLGAGIVAVVFWALWSWRNAWFARIVWFLHAFRLPALLEGSFLSDPGSSLPPSLYLVALGVVLVNLWMLARAGWDL